MENPTAMVEIQGFSHRKWSSKKSMENLTWFKQTKKKKWQFYTSAALRKDGADAAAIGIEVRL